MPDVRTLLDTTTARTPHPDPVAAVHRTVRRRTYRRRAATGAALSVALVATGAAAVQLTGEDAATPAADMHSGGTRWRQVLGLFVVAEPDIETMHRVNRIVDAHRDVFVGMRPGYEGSAYGFDVVFSADAEPDEWLPELREAAGSLEVRVHRCAWTAAYLDGAAAEVASAPFPSGARVQEDPNHPYGWRVNVEFPCTVAAVLDREPAVADDAYAEARWGGAVVVRSASEAGYS